MLRLLSCIYDLKCMSNIAFQQTLDRDLGT